MVPARPEANASLVVDASATPAVLIVEDDRVDAMVLRELLERDGRFGHIHVVRDGEQALGLWQQAERTMVPPCAEFPPDIVFLDINMPKMDGFEFLSAYEKLPETFRTKTKVVLLLGGLEPDRDRDRARIHEVVVASLEKPFTSLAVGEVADHLIGPREPRRPHRRSH